MKSINVGIQLYSVREEIEKYGIDSVFEELGKAGCNSVEFAGFYGLSPEQMKEKLDKYGLRPLAAHIKIDDIEPSLEYIDKLGISMVYIPSYPVDKLRDEEGFLQFTEKVKRVKALLDSRSVRFGYHNHARELDGEDLLTKMTDAVIGFTIELDIYWAKAAGRDPTEVIESLNNRISALHIKDMDKRADVKKPTEYPNAIIGEGVCGAESAFRAALARGIDTFILEVEYYPTEYTEYIKKSVDNINGYLN